MITIVSYPTNTEQAPRGRGGTVHPIILDLGTRWVWVVSNTLRPCLTRGKGPLYPSERRLGGPQIWSGHRG